MFLGSFPRVQALRVVRARANSSCAGFPGGYAMSSGDSISLDTSVTQEAFGVRADLAAGALDRNSIIERTGLTRSQTRYALEKLIATDRVAMHGGLGARNTTYSLAEED